MGPLPETRKKTKGLLLLKVFQRLLPKGILENDRESKGNEERAKYENEATRKQSKHIGFLDICYHFWCRIWKIWEYISSSKLLSKYVIEELIKPSSIKKERRKIEDSFIKKLFDPWNRAFEDVILSFNKNQIKDKNGHVGKALQSLRELLASGFY